MNELSELNGLISVVTATSTPDQWNPPPVTRLTEPSTRLAPFKMTTAIDKIMESFLHPIATPIAVIPTYDTMVDQIYQISYNTASMHMPLSDGKLGFLTLTVYMMVYMTLYTNNFEKNPNSGPEPMILPNATGIKQTSIRYKFTVEKEL